MKIPRFLTVGVAIVGLTLLLSHSVLSAPGLPLLTKNFTQSNEQGFGDRQNSWSWSMQWWDGKLYAGTNRAMECVEMASLAYNLPELFSYPPSDPDITCTESPQDLPLQAEIWRWAPETEVWERVFQSPNDVEIPDYPGKYVARDIGFRGMTVFTGTDGTEALYVSGFTSRMYNKGVPPPRILRSVDGVTFEAVPQDPGTFLGDLRKLDDIDINGFRSLVAYNGRLYVVAGRMRGDGVLLESENPAEGNDSFRMVTPLGVRVFEILSYNGFLYVGTYNPVEGYSVLKTDATGTPPYSFTPVITNGGHLEPFYSRGALSMYAFKGRLYVGTDRPAEIIRINPDDSWDLIVGTPRETPDGTKVPLSGFGPGFDYFMNGHIWRMGEHDDWLYVGTMDQSTAWKEVPFIADILEPYMGFDLFTSADGEHFTMITRTGFDSKFDYGVRTFASTPYGLFLGTSNEYYGTRVFRGVHGEVYSLFLPFVELSSRGTMADRQLSAEMSMMQSLSRPLSSIKPPKRLDTEINDGAVVLSWERPPGATRFHVFRSAFTSNHQVQSFTRKPNARVPERFVEVGVTHQAFFVDNTVPIGPPYYHYYVLAEESQGSVSQPSNLVRAPSLAPVVTFWSLENSIATWNNRSEMQSLTRQNILLMLADARNNAREGQLTNTIQRLEQLRSHVTQDGSAVLDSWRAEDLAVKLGKLIRRVRLAQAGVIPLRDL